MRQQVTCVDEVVQSFPDRNNLLICSRCCREALTSELSFFLLAKHLLAVARSSNFCSLRFIVFGSSLYFVLLALCNFIKSFSCWNDESFVSSFSSLKSAFSQAERFKSVRTRCGSSISWTNYVTFSDKNVHQFNSWLRWIWFMAIYNQATKSRRRKNYAKWVKWRFYYHKSWDKMFSGRGCVHLIRQTTK